MSRSITWVGLDAHKEFIQVAAIVPGAEDYTEWRVANDERSVRRLAKRLQKLPGEARCCYEAGPCGFVLKRQLEAAGVSCVVIAPSLIPKRPGDRVKTDVRDARELARLFKAGLLTEVHVPDEEQEAVRDLCRCREDARNSLTAARHQLSKFLLRRGRVYRAGCNWTHKHRKWLKEQSFDVAVEKLVFDDYLLMVSQLEVRLASLEEEMVRVVQSDRYRAPVGRLRCFRGIDTVTALTLVAEIHDVRRFKSAPQLMSYVGITPSEHSSGGVDKRGGITKAGNAHLRRVLIESAWAYRHRPSVGATLAKRRKDQPAEAIALADKAQQRLCRRYTRLTMAGKPSNKAVVAVARELTGFVWAALHQEADAAV